MSEIWGYAGLTIGLAMIGALVILRSEHRSNFVLAGGLCFAVYLITNFITRPPGQLTRASLTASGLP